MALPGLKIVKQLPSVLLCSTPAFELPHWVKWGGGASDEKGNVCMPRCATTHPARPWPRLMHVCNTDAHPLSLPPAPAQLCGRAYRMDQGRPAEDRPDVMERLRIIAKNPVACAQFFMLFLKVNPRN